MPILRNHFSGGKETGASIAALKCLIAITHKVNFHDLNSLISFSQLEDATGLSRPMVSKGVSRLVSNRIITIKNDGYRNVYVLTDNVHEYTNWAKIPHKYLKEALPEISNRGRVTLYALKIYLYLLAIRPNDSAVIFCNYDTFEEKLGLQRKYIRSALDILFNHGLLHKHVDVAIIEGEKYISNSYEVRGILKPVKAKIY